MAPNKSTKTKGQKQSTLNFKNTKYAAGLASGKPRKGSSLRQSISASQLESNISSSSGESDVEIVVRAKTRSRSNPSPSEQPIEVAQPLDWDNVERKYSAVYINAVKQNNSVHLIHAEGQSKIHHILRVFDNTYDYGPCVGVTRLERWDRAKEMGLNPPDEIRDILMTQEGLDDLTLVHPVFYEEV